MGNKPGACYKGIDYHELAREYRLEEEQITFLIKTLKGKGKGKCDLDQKTFVKSVAKLREKYPEIVNFDDEVAGLVWTYCDTNHDNKVDPVEIVATISTFAVGSPEDRARMVFAAFNHDGNEYLSRKEMKNHATMILGFSLNVASHRMKKIFKQEVKFVLDQINKGEFSDDIGNDIFDKVKELRKKEKKEGEEREGEKEEGERVEEISIEEWIEVSKDCNTAKAMLNPAFCAKTWTWIYKNGEISAKENMEMVRNHPKRWTSLIDLMIQEEGMPLSPNFVPKSPPGSPISISLSSPVSSPVSSPSRDRRGRRIKEIQIEYCNS